MYGPHTAAMAASLLARSWCPSSACTSGRAWTASGSSSSGARVWRLHGAYRFRCEPFMAGFMELKHCERRELKDAGSVVAEKVVKLTQNAIFGRCCMNPDKFRNTAAYVDPAKFERAVGRPSMTNFEFQINDSEGFLGFVETLKTSRSTAFLAVPTQIGCHTLQVSKLMMEKAFYLHLRRLFPSTRLLFTDTDSVMVQIFELQDPIHAMADANLRGAELFDVAGPSKAPERDLGVLAAPARAKAIELMGQLGKLGDETFPARILEYVGLRSKMYSILTVQPDGKLKEKRKVKGVLKKAAAELRHQEYREVLEESGERRATFATLRSREHQVCVETVEKKSLSAFNDKVFQRRPQLAAAGALAQPGAAAAAGRLRAARHRGLRERHGVPHRSKASWPPLGNGPVAAALLLRPDSFGEKKGAASACACVCCWVQGWLLEKPAAWVGLDAPDLAAAVMVQRPPSERPREDALLQAERSRRDLLVEDRDRLQGLLENTQEELAEARALDGEIGLVSSEVAYSHSQYSRTQKAKLALRFFKADLKWSGWWDYWDVRWRDCTSCPRAGRCALGRLAEIPVQHLFGHPSKLNLDPISLFSTAVTL